jgi:CheY-like chemotaxis protein
MAETATPAKARVLVVDDSSLVRLYYRSALKTAGFEVKQAINGIEAMEKSGALLTRASKIFFALTGSNTNDTFQKIEAEESMVKIGYLPHSSGVDVTLAAAAPEAAWVRENLGTPATA